MRASKHQHRRNQENAADLIGSAEVLIELELKRLKASVRSKLLLVATVGRHQPDRAGQLYPSG